MNDEMRRRAHAALDVLLDVLLAPATCENSKVGGDLVPLSALPVSPRTARRLIKSGALPAQRVGRGYLVARADAERFFAPTLAKAKVPAKPPTASARRTHALERAGVVAHR